MIGLTHLPIELIHKICSNLDAVDVLSLGQTCTRLHCWISDPQFWRSRLKSLWSLQYPVLPGETVDWLQACCSREKACQLWSGYFPERLHHCETNHGICQTIDAIHVLPPGNLILVGGRDRYFTVFNRDDMLSGPLNDTFVFQDSTTHTGWIWTISSFGSRVLTGSWDNYARFWSLDSSSPRLISKHKLPSAVLCSDFLDPHTSVVGTYNKAAVIIDQRQCPSMAIELRHHTRPILRLAVKNRSELDCASPIPSCCELSDYESTDEIDIDLGTNNASSLPEYHQPDEVPVSPLNAPDGRAADNGVDNGLSVDNDSASLNMSIVYTTSEDSKLLMWDLRQAANPVYSYRLKSYARTLTLFRSQLWIVDRTGTFQLFDIRNGILNHIQESKSSSYDWPKSLGQLHVEEGFMIAASLDGSVQSLHSSREPYVMGPPLIEGLSGGASSLSFYNNTLVVGTCSGKVLFWTPK